MFFAFRIIFVFYIKVQLICDVEEAGNVSPSSYCL